MKCITLLTAGMVCTLSNDTEITPVSICVTPEIMSAYRTFYTRCQYLLHSMSIVSRYKGMSDRPYLYSHIMMMVMLLVIINNLKLFTNVKLCWFTWTFVSWAWVANISHYNSYNPSEYEANINDLDELHFTKLKASITIVTTETL